MEVDSEVEGSAISIARESAVKDGRIMPSMMEIDGEEEEEEEEEEEIKEEETKFQFWPCRFVNILLRVFEFLCVFLNLSIQC